MIHDQVKTSLEMIGIPVEFHQYEGAATTYITYLQYDERGHRSADDVEIATNVYFQVNLFSQTDYKEEVTQIKKQMNEIGGTRTSSVDLFDSGWYQRSMRFVFTVPADPL